LAVAEKPDRLFERTSHALKWSYAGNSVRTVSQLIFGIVLARLLGPKAFGAVALAWVVISVGTVVSDLGFGAALVQRRELSEKDVRFVFTTQVCVGAGLSLAGIVLADVIAALFRQPETGPILRAMALLFILQSFGQTALAILRRGLNFKADQTISMVSYIVPYGLVGIPCAYLGCGAWSLVAAQLLQSALSSLLALRRTGMSIRPTFSASSPGLFVFGSKVIGANLTYWGLSNIDSVVIGRALGTADLGLYSRAMTLVMTPMYALTSALQGVMLAYCSRAQADVARLRRAYLGASLCISVVCLPLFVTISVIPETVIRGLLGDAWAAAAPVLRPLSLSMVAFAMVTAIGPVLTAMNRVTFEIRAQLVTLAVMVPALLFAAKYSVRAVAWAVLALCLVRLLLLVTPLLTFLEVRWIEALSVLVWPTVFAAAVAVPTWGADHLLRGAPPAPRLLSVVGVAGVSTIVAARLLGRRVLRSPHAAFLLAEGRIPPAVGRFLRL
jgi:PST family polysaccharide transporter